MKRLLASVLFFLSAISFANAQAVVVASCGTPPPIYSSVGAVLPFTVDTTGKLCSVATGGGGTPGGANGNIQFNNSGSFGGLTDVQVTARIQLFSSTLSGAVPASGGGTTNFLRADGTFAAPPASPPCTTTAGALQYNNAGSFGCLGTYNGTNFIKLAVDAAAPGTQTIAGQSTSTGTLNVAGGDFVIQGGLGTGTGAGGNIILQTALAGASGSTQNAASEHMRIDNAGSVLINTTTKFSNAILDIGTNVNVDGGIVFQAYGASNTGAAFTFTKTRGTGPNNHVAVQVGDRIGRWFFDASDGTSFQDTAEFGAVVDTVAVGNVTADVVFFNTGSETARFTSNNSVIAGGITNDSTIGGQQIILQANNFAASTVTSIGAIAYGASTAGSNLALIKTRANFPASGTAVLNNDVLGGTQFWGDVDTGASHFVNAGQITGEVDSATISTTSLAGRLVFYTTLVSTTTPIERMRIDNAGGMTAFIGGPAGAQVNAQSAISGLQTQNSGGGNWNETALSYGNVASGPSFAFIKTRGATAQTHAIAVNGDNIGEIDWTMDDGTFYDTAGAINVIADGTVAAGNTPGRLQFLTTKTTASTPTEAMRIDSSQRTLLGGAAAQTSEAGAATPTFQINHADVNANMSITRWQVSANAPKLYLNKSRGAAIGTQGLVNSGDFLGALYFEGSDGATMQPAAFIAGVAEGTPAANNMPGAVVLFTSPSGTTTPTEVMRANNAAHINFTSTAPTASACAGFALGSGSSDTAGLVTFTSATSCAISFGKAFSSAPFCNVTPASAASTVEATTSTTVLTATFGTAQTAMMYHCFGA